VGACLYNRTAEQAAGRSRRRGNDKLKFGRGPHNRNRDGVAGQEDAFLARNLKEEDKDLYHTTKLAEKDGCRTFTTRKRIKGVFVR